MRRITLVVACLTLLLLPLLTRADDANLVEAKHGKKIPNQYIVMLKDSANEDTDSDYIVKKHKGMLIFKYKNSFKGFAAQLSDDEVSALKAEPNVLDVIQDEEVSILGKNDVTAQAQTLPTGVDRINAEAHSNTGAGVEVAVIDTGIDASHPELKANVLGGYSCIKGESPTNDGNGHGTHVAGTIAAINNGSGVVGVAPGAKLWAVKVLDKNGSGTWSQVICGIDWVTSQASHIKVASMSLGGAGTAGTSCASSPMRQAICNSVNKGVTYVVAAGNDGGDLKNSVPAAFPEVIAVSALADSNGTACGTGTATSYGADDTFATFSNYATLAVDKARLIGAPGVNIYSTWKGNSYNTISGSCIGDTSSSSSSSSVSSEGGGSSSSSVSSEGSGSSSGGGPTTFSGLTDGPDNGGNGGHRGSDTNRLTAAINQTVADAGYGPGTPAPAFGGTGTDPLHDLFCSVQSMINPSSSLAQAKYAYAASLLHELTGRDEDYILAQITNLSLCAALHASRMPSQTTATVAAPRLVTLATDGYPSSNNKVWNLCVRGLVTSKLQLQANTDVSTVRQGQISVVTPKSCDAYRQAGNVWTSPEDPFLKFTITAGKPPIVQVNTGYVVVPATQATAAK